MPSAFASEDPFRSSGITRPGLPNRATCPPPKGHLPAPKTSAVLHFRSYASFRLASDRLTRRDSFLRWFAERAADDTCSEHVATPPPCQRVASSCSQHRVPFFAPPPPPLPPVGRTRCGRTAETMLRPRGDCTNGVPLLPPPRLQP
eukprot:1192819-Prorocentrum_minimum.AAC.2